MVTYYNENDRYPAAWLRNLIEAGHLPTGEVDERSIEDVKPEDLPDGPCHFFAGIGGWPLALRLAGIPDTTPVWTGSCPCAPFSVAGKRGGFSDKRHLWPIWFRIIDERRPPVILGEQVGGPAGLRWLDAVFSDLEGRGYACGAANLCACSVGAPHVRQRLYWVAYDNRAGLRLERGLVSTNGNPSSRNDTDGIGEDDALSAGLPGVDEAATGGNRKRILGEDERAPDARKHGSTVADTMPAGRAEGWAGTGERQAPSSGCDGLVADTHATRPQGVDGPREARKENVDARRSDRANPWSDLVWLPCSDGKARPTQPGLFPLAHGVSNRVGRLRAYGNAVVPQVAAQFIGAVIAKT